MGAEEPPFEVPLRKAMRRAGLKGSMAEVRLDRDVLTLTGDQDGAIVIPARDVERIRIARFETPASRHATRPAPPRYETWIWQSGGPGPLLIVPQPGRPARYGPVMREFAGWVFAEGGEVLRGPSLAVLLLQTVWWVGATAVIALLLIGGAIVEDRFWLWLVALFAASLPFMLFMRLRRKYWPRRVTRPDELEAQLPSREESE